ncbi:MAG: glycosyltransferase [Candidatus Saccharimonadales bacterium]
MARIARKVRAALYIAQQHATLPAAYDAAARTGALVAFDAEDLLAEYSSEPVAIMRSIEQRYVPKCAFVSTMSGAAASRLQETLNLPVAPLVLHNTPSLAERRGIGPPLATTPARRLQLYWFGQTIGPHSCAEQVLRAMSLMSRPAKLVLRGSPRVAYIAHLESLATRLGLTDHLDVHERASPNDMVRLAAQHDVLLGTQPSLEPFHQMAIGNKVFTGLMAGLVVALTDTVAHRLLVREVAGASFLFANDDHRALANRLNELDESRDKLMAMKTAAWRTANERFNWEKESEQLLSTVARLVGKAS